MSMLCSRADAPFATVFSQRLDAKWTPCSPMSLLLTALGSCPAGAGFKTQRRSLLPSFPLPRMPTRLLLESPVAWACFLVLAVDCGRELLGQASSCLEGAGQQLADAAQPP